VVDKTITMDNLRLLCLVVNVFKGTARRPRYKYSITARWKLCSRFINSRINAQYLPSYRLICYEVGSLFGILKYVCDIVVKSSRSLSHLLMSSCCKFYWAPAIVGSLPWCPVNIVSVLYANKQTNKQINMYSFDNLAVDVMLIGYCFDLHNPGFCARQ